MKIDFTLPTYLICDTPVKEDTFHDHRTWVYATQALSLIEFINTESFEDFEFKDFHYLNYTNNQGVLESWVGVFTQNNCEFTGNDPQVVMTQAWDIFKKHLTQLDDEY